MKAPKISIDSAKLQQMLLLHVEKIVLGVVLVAVLWFVYQGATLPGLESEKTPDVLAQDAGSVTTEINNPGHWEIIKKKREISHDVQGLVKQGQEPNEASHYPLKNGWKTPDYPKAHLRVDPRIFPPIKVKVVPLFGPLAYLPKMGDTDPIMGIEVAAGAETGRPAPQIRPGVQQPRPRVPGEGGRQPPRRQPGRQQPGMLDGGGEGMQQEGFGPGFGPGLGASATGSRTLPPEAMVGFRASSEVTLKEGKAVVVLAAVPMEKQLEEYEKAFKEALDYDEYRDIPRYVLFLVERADVTADPAQDPATATWTSLKIVNALNEMNSWANSPREIVEPNTIDPVILTHRAPPFLQREVYEALVHPDIPKAKVLAVDPNAGGNQPQLPGDAVGNGQPLNEGDLLGPDAAAPAGVPGQGNIEGGPRPGGPRPGGMMQPPGMRQPGMMQPGMQRGGYGEGMAGMSNPSQEMTVAKYKLLRFTDTTVEYLHKYRYRVKLLVEDPNNPYVSDRAPRWDLGRTTPLRKPSIQSMSPNVLNRVRTVEAAPAGPKAKFIIESEPSEASDVVELPAPERYFAGKATPVGGSAIKPGTPIIPTSQPSVNLLTVAWDKDKAVDVPAEKEVFRGSPLNFEKEVDVIHPALLVIHPIGKYPFRTNSIVVDFAGGDEIPSLENKRSDTKVPEPCEILVFDGLGNLQLLDETDDVDGFRRYLPPKIDVPKASTGTTINPDGQDPGGGLLNGPGPVRRPGGGK